MILLGIRTNDQMRKKEKVSMQQWQLLEHVTLVYKSHLRSWKGTQPLIDNRNKTMFKNVCSTQKNYNHSSIDDTIH